MFDQQLDLDGGAHDIAPTHEQPKLFGSVPQLRGQIALDTDPLPVEPMPSRYRWTLGASVR